jgi:transcriptional regulator with XRE-family HTH domain
MPRMAADTMRKLIKQAGLSQREAANEIGVTQRTFRDWCAGESEPPRAVLTALELLSIKRRNQLMAGKRKTQVRTDGPFTIHAVTDDTVGKPDLRGYVIEGPGSDSSWLLSAEQVGQKLQELKAKLGR